ncbi:hypothetical protein TNCV_3561531 [Trichonephila clavipes]|nr:hypothetical protein TNCV_3561531 [Trichonephila clavipes]
MRKKRKHCCQSAFRLDSSSKPETDESHLVRDQDCMMIGVGTLNQEFLYGFACGLPLPSKNRTLDLRSPDQFFRIASFNFDRMSQYRVALMVTTSKKSIQK